MKKFFKLGKDKKKSSSTGNVADENDAEQGAVGGMGNHLPGYDIKEKDLGKIHKAIINGEADKVMSLVKKEVNTADKQQRSPLHLACAKGNSNIVKILLEWKAKVNAVDAESKTPMIKATECQHEKIIEQLLDAKANPNLKDKHGNTALHYAARDGQESLVDLLLSEDTTDIDAKNKQGHTPLHVTILHNRLDTCNVLLESGADINLQDNELLSPLMMASQKGLDKFVELLLQNKADPTLKDKNGWTADDLAAMGSHTECRKLLSTGPSNISPRDTGDGTQMYIGSDADDSDNEVQKAEEPPAQEIQVSSTKEQKLVDSVEEVVVTQSRQDVVKEISQPGDTSIHVDDKWSDNDSDLSAGDSPRKIPLVELHEKIQKSKEEATVQQILEVNDDWDDDSTVLSSHRDQNKPKISLLKVMETATKGQNTELKKDDPVIDSNQPEKKSTLSSFQVPTPKSQSEVEAMMKDLGLDDISSDSGSDMEGARFIPSMLKDKQAPPPTAVKTMVTEGKQDSEDSEWDSTAAPEIASNKTGRVPVSARSAKSGGSNWDSSVLDEEDEEKKKPLKISAAPTKTQSSPWDEDEDDDSLAAGHTLASEKSEVPSVSLQPDQAQVTRQKQDSPRKDKGSVEDIVEAVESLVQPQLKAADVTSSLDKVDAKKNSAPENVKGEEKEESDWDSDVSFSEADNEIEAMLQPKIGAVATQPAGEAVKATTVSTRPPFSPRYSGKESNDDSEEEEEEESSWEVERKMKKLAQTTQVNPMATINETQQKEIQQKKAEEERKVKEEEEHRQKLENERAKMEQERQKLEEDKKRREEQEIQQKREEEEKKILEHGRQRKEEEMQLQEQKRKDEMKRKEEERLAEERQKSEMAQREEQERKRKEGEKQRELDRKKEEQRIAELKKQEEADRKKKLEQQKADEKRRKEEEKKKAEEMKQEEKRLKEEKKRQEEEEKKKAKEKKKEDKEQKKPAALPKGITQKEQGESSEEDELSKKWQLEWQQKQEQRKKEAQDELKKEREQLEHSRQSVQKAVRTMSGGLSGSPEHKPPERPQNDLESGPPFKRLGQIGKASGNMDMYTDSEDEDDTFNGIEVASMETPLRDHSRLGTSTAYSMKTEGGVVIHREEDEEDLSYSSTDQDVSQGQEVIKSSIAALQGGSPTMNNNNIGNGLESSTLAIRLQEQLRDTQRKLEKERQNRVTQESKRKSLEQDREDMLRKLEDTCITRSELEKARIDLEARVRSLDYSVHEEAERRRNAEVLYEKVQEHLLRREEQYNQELQQRQKLDLSLRNLQMELRSALSANKQLEDEKEDLERRLNQERTARLLQEQINEEQLQFHQNLATEHEALANLESTDENRKEISENNDRLKVEIASLKNELKRARARNKDDHDLLIDENENLCARIEDLKLQLKTTEDALTQASVQYNLELSDLKGTYSKVKTNIDKEMINSERLETELSAKKQLVKSIQLELDRERLSRTEQEKSTHKLEQDWRRALDQANSETSQLRELNKSYSERMTSLESKISRLESDCAVAKATLAERTTQLQTLTREKEYWLSKGGDYVDYKGKDDSGHNYKLESLSKQVKELQHEKLSLEHKLHEAQDMLAHGQTGEDVNAMLSKLRLEQEANSRVLETKNSTLLDENSRLREEAKVLSNRYAESEHEVKRLQNEMASTHKNLASSETRLEIFEKTREQLERENSTLRKEIDRLAVRVQELQDKLLDSQTKVAELTHKSLWAEESAETFQRDLRASTTSKTELEDKIRELQRENAVLSSKTEADNHRIEALKEELQLAKQAANVQATERVASVQYQMQTESKSKIFELEKENARLASEEDKKRARNSDDVRRVIEEQLTEEQEKNKQMQKSISLLKSHLKAAKKKIQGMTTTALSTADLAPPTDYNAVNSLRIELDQTREDLTEELRRLRLHHKDMPPEKDVHELEQESRRLRDMYDNEVALRQRLLNRLEQANQQAQKAAVLLDRQQQFTMMDWVPGVGAQFYKNKNSNNRLEELTIKLRQQLDRSIARHLAKSPQIDIAIPSHRTLDDTILSTTQFSNTHQDYLKTLQKNYFV